MDKIHEAIKRHKYKTMRKITVREQERRQLESRDNIESLETLRLLMDTGLRVIRQFRIVETREKDLKNNLLRILSEESLCSLPETEEKMKKQQSYYIPVTDMVYYEAVLARMPEPKLFAAHYHDDQYLSNGEKYADVIYAVYPDQASEYEKNILNRMLESVIEDRDIQEMIHRADEKGVRQWFGYQFKQYLAELLAV